MSECPCGFTDACSSFQNPGFAVIFEPQLLQYWAVNGSTGDSFLKVVIRNGAKIGPPGVPLGGSVAVWNSVKSAFAEEFCPRSCVLRCFDLVEVRVADGVSVVFFVRERGVLF